MTPTGEWIQVRTDNGIASNQNKQMNKTMCNKVNVI